MSLILTSKNSGTSKSKRVRKNEDMRLSEAKG